MPRDGDDAARRHDELMVSLSLSLADKFGEWRDDPAVWWVELGAIEPPRLAKAVDRVRRLLSITASNVADDIAPAPVDELTEALTEFVAELVYLLKRRDDRAGRAT